MTREIKFRAWDKKHQTWVDKDTFEKLWNASGFDTERYKFVEGWSNYCERCEKDTIGETTTVPIQHTCGNPTSKTPENERLSTIPKDWEKELKPRMKYTGVPLDKEVWDTLQELLDYYWEELKPKISTLLNQERQKIIGEIEEMNNFRNGKIDNKEDWNSALEQSACKIDALIQQLKS